MIQILAMLISFVAGCLIVFAALRSSLSLRLTRITLPFISFDVSDFENLSPVKMFAKLSIAVLSANPQVESKIELLINTTPVALIHVGWNMVCNAFMERFNAYPDEEQIKRIAPIVGSENAKFLAIYSQVHSLSGKHSEKIKRKFAIDYVVRAPSLAQRINPIYDYQIESDISNSLLATASDLAIDNEEVMRTASSLPFQPSQ